MVFVLFIGWFVGVYYEAGYTGIAFAAMFSIPTALASYFSSDKVALAVNGAKPIDKDRSPEEKELYRLVENIAITAGMPVPKIHIIDDSAMNAFATGRDPEHASIAFTTGILSKLEKSELEGVAAHELSHIQNYDTRLSTIVVILVGMIALLTDFFFRFGFFFGGGRKSDSNSGPLGGVLAIAGLVLIIFAPIIAKLISLAVSRKREFLADASGALLTRYPEGLARALVKISQDSNVLKRANNATMHLYFESPFSGKKKKNTMQKLFSTHPPTEERVEALTNMDIERFREEYTKR